MYQVDRKSVIRSIVGIFVSFGLGGISYWLVSISYTAKNILLLFLGLTLAVGGFIIFVFNLLRLIIKRETSGFTGHQEWREKNNV